MKSKKIFNYAKSRAAVDAVIFTIKNQKLSVYLNIREKEPYMGLKELPGGLLLEGEMAEETLSRKLKDITSAENIFFEQFFTFTKPNRDPRERTISIGFIALILEYKVINIDNFHEISNLKNLAFDHNEIIQKAFKYLQNNLDHQIVKQFLPQYFPLNDLQMVYEVIGQTKLDNRNFRKKVLNLGIVEKINKVEKNVSHRPASLYKFV